jgi:hypothetical protein
MFNITPTRCAPVTPLTPSLSLSLSLSLSSLSLSSLPRWYNFSIYPGGCSGSPVGGPTEEDTHCLTDTGHSGDLAWTTAMTDSWCAVRHRAFEAALAAGGWFWCVSLHARPRPQARDPNS